MVLEVTVVACGAPKRGMGWYHCKQLLDGRVEGAKLANIVEPFFLGAGKDTPAGKDFEQWTSTAAKGVSLHTSITESPKPSGPKLVIICGRTSDNPRLFREAVDHGFSHVYLEKPGAPTVDELTEMAEYAKGKKVPVYMGFNRNFSKYVRSAQGFIATQVKSPDGVTFTLGRNDCFNTPESLDECFERNAEGMLKNMMIHEIVVLISYFGLQVDSIKKIVADKGYTCIETRKGFTDLSKMACTIKTKSGQQFKLWGDRSNGEYGEAVVTTATGKEAFKSVRPDEEISKNAAEIEEANPGCMPYFYLQDGEYLALKKQVVQHIASGLNGGSSPEGVASVETAIEGLKLCDCITEALMSKTAPAAKTKAKARAKTKAKGKAKAKVGAKSKTQAKAKAKATAKAKSKAKSKAKAKGKVKK
jgi:predicted dehydrogenase